MGPAQRAIRGVISSELDERLLHALRHDSPDHRILNAAMKLQQGEPGRAEP